MPRPCAVFGCENDEENVICHRFPNDQEMALLWKNELNLKDFSVEMLEKNFTVCNEHFTDADYKHIHELKSTAIPMLGKKHKVNNKTINIDLANGSSSDNSDSIEIVPPTKKNLALLQATLAAMEEEDKQQPTYEMEESIASTKNSEDIFVLEAQESYYEPSKHNLEKYISTNSPDFIILNVPNIHANKPKQQDQENVKTANSGADSDVEILQNDDHNTISNPIINMSKSVKEITAAIALASLDTNYEPKNSDDTIDSPTPTDNELQLPSLEPLGEIGDFPEFFTDQEISVDELSNHTTTCSSANLYPVTNEFDELARQELLKVIHEQAAHIEKLETILQRYRSTQKMIIGHVDAMHAELENINAVEENSHILPNTGLK